MICFIPPDREYFALSQLHAQAPVAAETPPKQEKAEKAVGRKNVSFRFHDGKNIQGKKEDFKAFF